MPHEMFCEYEPFDHTMIFAYTNGGEGYIAVDKDLAMGAKDGYEAACLPTWGANSTVSGHGAPPAVGIEGIIENSIASLWAEN